MIDHTYRVRLTTGTILHVFASTVQIEGDQLAFVGSKGNLSALFVAELVGSWKMLPNVTAAGALAGIEGGIERTDEITPIEKAHWNPSPRKFRT